MKRYSLFSSLGLVFCATLFSGELAPQKLDDWTGYALEHFLKEKDGVISTKRRHIDIDSRASIKIDPKRTYVVSGSFRRLPGSENKPLRISFGIAPCNAAGQRILNTYINPYPGTETELSRDAGKGDRAIYVKDASKWNKGRWNSTVFDCKADGSDLPNDKVSTIITSIRKHGDEWQITFRKALTQAYRKGTPVRQHFASNKPFICAAIAAAKDLPAEWTEFSGEVTGILPQGRQTYSQFWHGTVSARIRIDAAGDIEFKNISLKEKQTK